MLKACILLIGNDAHPSRLGEHYFEALPRAGEFVCVGDGMQEHVFRVLQVRHRTSGIESPELYVEESSEDAFRKSLFQSSLRN